MRSKYRQNDLTKATRKRALRLTADEYGLTVVEVKQAIKLQADYFKAQIKAIDIEGDLINSITKIQIPMMGGFMVVHKYHMIESMLKFGHITKKQYDMLRERFGRNFKKQENKYNKQVNYGKASEEYERRTKEGFTD